MTEWQWKVLLALIRVVLRNEPWREQEDRTLLLQALGGGPK